MKSCPFCREQIADDAIKCRYCQSMLVPGLPSSTGSAEPQLKGKVTYVVDEGLVTFAKFSGAVLALFILVGTYLFGIKLEVTVDKMGAAQRQLEKSEKDIESLRTTAANVQKQLEQATNQSAAMLAEIERNRQTSVLIIANLRTKSLTPQETALLDETRKASPEKSRGPTSKLWPNGATPKSSSWMELRNSKKSFEMLWANGYDMQIFEYNT